MELVSVTSVNDVGLASIIKGVLDQAGIDAVISNASEDVFPAGTVDTVHILVKEDDVQRALDLLEQYETAPEPEDDEQ